MRLSGGRALGTGHRVADFRIGKPDQGDDVAGVGRADVVPPQLVEQLDRGDVGGLVASVFADQHDFLILRTVPL